MTFSRISRELYFSTREFLDQLCLHDVRSVVCFSISCKREFLDQLYLMFDQLSVFRSVVSVSFSISCALFSISCLFFDQK